MAMIMFTLVGRDGRVGKLLCLSSRVERREPSSAEQECSPYGTRRFGEFAQFDGGDSAKIGPRVFLLLVSGSVALHPQAKLLTGYTQVANHQKLVLREAARGGFKDGETHRRIVCV